MSTNTYVQDSIDAFFSACAPMMNAYRHSTFSYVAVKHGEQLVVVHARLGLWPLESAPRTSTFRSRTVCARHHRVADLASDPKTLLTMLLSGSLETPEGILRLPPSPSGQHSTHFDPFHEEGLRAQN